ncbi:hypothetical protein IAI10_13170 [Clostridium sp. 19966]|uniref:hypothetical protein n=1 Tax=Clostridium sp. 19966 TaxID=2768166 RepID=UPI0028DDD771|nr:hypothetical protein [Clostridium sp. 19966]MDT8717617.1 hypothetical protein [Clostridium sp. 19966]
MRCTFRTRWENHEIACICTLKNKCIHAGNCEELDFRLNAFEGIKGCMQHSSYKRQKGALRQVKHK